MFDRKLKKWTYTGTSVPDTLAKFASAPFSWDRWQQNNANRTREPVIKPTIKLREHQQPAAEAIAAPGKAPGFLLADDVGLGKTYSTVVGLNRRGKDLNILVLCPLSVVAHWRRSLELAGTGGNQWCILNYDRAKHLLDVPASALEAKRTRTRNKRIAQKGTGLVQWDVVVCDESHRLKNPLSQRSAAVRNIIGKKDAAFVVYLSATAGQNPLELAYLAPLLAYSTKSSVRSMADFELWCTEQGLAIKKGRFGGWVWDRNEEDLETIREMLFDGKRPIGMRRRPQDLAGWPELNRSLFELELNVQERRLYEQAWDEFRAAMALFSAGDETINPLVLSMRFRQKASLLRVPHTAAAVKDFRDDSFQVAVSVQFIETAEALQEQLRNSGVSSVVLSGETKQDERERRRIEFQQGAVDVVIFTVTEGISLHAGEEAVQATATPRVLLIHDIRWSALETVQIEGRCHRDGQNALAYYLYAVRTVEAKVAAAVLGKMSDMGKMLGDNTLGLDPLIDETTSHIE